MSDCMKICSAEFIGIAFGVLFVTRASRDRQFVVIVTRDSGKEYFVRAAKAKPDVHCFDGRIEVAGITAGIGEKVEVIEAK